MPSMTPSISPIISPVANRYATSFLDVVLENKAGKAVSSDIEDLKAMMQDESSFSSFIQNAVFSREDQMNVLDALSKKAKFHNLTANFLKLLAKNKRLGQLTEMLRAYQVALDTREGNTHVSVITPFPLKTSQEKKIKAELDKALKTNTKITPMIDKSLLGGTVITVGSLMIDDSVKGKLERLTRAMKAQQAS